MRQTGWRKSKWWLLWLAGQNTVATRLVEARICVLLWEASVVAVVVEAVQVLLVSGFVLGLSRGVVKGMEDPPVNLE